MDFPSLDRDRFLKKDPNQTDQTKGAAYTAINPKPKIGNDDRSKIGQPNKSQEDAGAPNILTGTVIVSCFIQTSALPSRIEMQGNDLTFFDDTTETDGQIEGDTSRLIFTHGSAKYGEKITAGFILEKRCSTFNSYDNVLSLYSPPSSSGDHNYVFLGRNAFDGSRQDRNISSFHFAVDFDSTFHPEGNNPLNGVWEIEYSEAHEYKSRLIYVGNTQSLFPGASFTGYSGVMIAGDGGLAGLGYTTTGGLSVPLYVKQGDEVTLGANLIPDADATYDIGSASFQIKDLYISGTIHGGGSASIYSGIIDSGGATGSLPPGWSVSALGVGDYVVTHNLGVPNSVVPGYSTPAGSINSNDNSFEVQCTNLAGTPTDGAVNFILKVL